MDKTANYLLIYIFLLESGIEEGERIPVAAAGTVILLTDSSTDIFGESIYSLEGRLYPEKNFTTLLYGANGDAVYPLLYTFTSSGTNIDSLDLGGMFW